MNRWTLSRIFGGAPDFAAEIEAATSAPSLARILRRADKHYAKQDIQPAGALTAGMKPEQDLLESPLRILQDKAKIRLNDIGLRAVGLEGYHAHLLATYLVVDEAIRDIDWDLSTDLPMTSLDATDAIQRAHASLSQLLAAIPTWPADLRDIAPSMENIRNPNSDKTVSSDAKWDIVDFANYHSRKAIGESYGPVKETLAAAITEMRRHAQADLEQRHAGDMKYLLGTVINVDPDLRPHHQAG
jgi:hypothetical protein